MPSWLSRILKRIHELAGRRRVRFTLKALSELAELGLGLDAEDACDALAKLKVGESAGRIVSESTGEWMYIFRFRIDEIPVYAKVIVRNDCIVVSFHEEKTSQGGEGT